jgi:hypothetical protein
METLTKFSLSGILFLLTLASGLWLHAAGKPLNTAIFNLHKLIALAAVVVTVFQLSKALKTMSPQTLLVLLFVAAGVCVLALFASGALMSIGALSYTTMQVLHAVTAALLVAAMSGTAFLLAGRVA